MTVSCTISGILGGCFKIFRCDARVGHPSESRNFSFTFRVLGRKCDWASRDSCSVGSLLCLQHFCHKLLALL